MERKTGKIRILLVEDNCLIRQVLLNFLEKGGYWVDLVENGALAVESFRKSLHDLVLMDIDMPIMDGYNASRAIRSIESEISSCSNLVQSPRVPITAITAFPLVAIEGKYFQAGMDDYICKPFMQEDLLSKVEGWLNPRTESPASFSATFPIK